MLIKCPECDNDVSSEATACPKCGHPLAAKPEEKSAKKVSHGAGWIALASIILGTFTPAILAPVFVLVSLIFAGKELSRGSKVFGVIVLCLALIQGWFVLDHFGAARGTSGGINGTLTEKEVDAETASKYPYGNSDVPMKWKEIAEAKCSADWPSDYKMQEHCVERQEAGVQALDMGALPGISPNAFKVIRGKCAQDWPRDFQMRAHCQGRQFDGYIALEASTAEDDARDACARQWPDDYQMRRHCLTKER